MKSKAGKRTARVDAAAGGASLAGSPAAAATRGATTPLSNTGVNSGVSHGESEGRTPRDVRSGKFEPLSLANDAELRAETLRVVEALDLLLPVFEDVVVQCAREGGDDDLMFDAMGRALVGLAGLRASITLAAEAQGVRFPVGAEAVPVLRHFASVMQADARARLAAGHSLLRVGSHAKGEGRLQ